MTAPKVFISYSHQDESWKDLLVSHLGVLQQEGILEVWDDRRIAAGEDWQGKIDSAMEEAQAAVLLISSHFLSSAFICGTEVTRLLERHAKEGLRIIPLIVRPCPWHLVSWLSKLQCRPIDGRALVDGSSVQIEKDLSALAEEIAGLVAAVAPSTPHGRRNAELWTAVDTLQDVASTLAALAGRMESLFARLEMAGQVASLSRLRHRLETDRFRLVVLGGFGHGKSTLVNALLAADILPTRPTPCTAVVTSVRWGQERKALLHFRDPLPSELPDDLPPDVLAHLQRAGNGPVPFLEIPIERLRDYIENASEPAAETPYSNVEIRWPLELCRNGAEIIDTPGLNHRDEGTRLAIRHLQHADAVLFTATALTPLVSWEFAWIDELFRAGVENVLCALTHWDKIPEGEREKHRRFIVERLNAQSQITEDCIFYISALDALQARLAVDPQRLESSGILLLEQAIAGLLAREWKGVKLLPRARELSGRLREVEQVIADQCQFLDAESAKLTETDDHLVSRLNAVEQRSDHLHWLLGHKNAALRFEVRLEIERILRQLIPRVPRWAEDLKTERKITLLAAHLTQQVREMEEEIVEKIRERIQQDLQMWADRSLERVLAKWLDDLDRNLGEIISDNRHRIDRLVRSFLDQHKPVRFAKDASYFFKLATEHRLRNRDASAAILNLLVMSNWPILSAQKMLKRRVGENIQRILEDNLAMLAEEMTEQIDRQVSDLLRRIQDALGSDFDRTRGQVEADLQEAHSESVQIQARRSLLEEIAAEAAEVEFGLRGILSELEVR